MLHRAAERTLLREGAAAATEERERSGLGKTRGEGVLAAARMVGAG